MSSTLPAAHQLAVLRRPGPPLTIDEIRRHPRFEDACDCYLVEMLSLYDGDHRLIKGLVEFVRAVVFMLIVSLDAAHDPRDPKTHLTLPRLRALLAQVGITQPRRINDIVQGFQQDGFLVKEPSPHNGRIKIYRATEKMLATDRQWLAVYHAPLALLYPEVQVYQMAMARDPAYQNAYRRADLITLLNMNDIIGHTPEVSFFLGEEVGFRILMLLMREARANPDDRTGPGFFTRAAGEAKVSRTHVRNVMKRAEEREMVSLGDASGRSVQVLPLLQEGFRNWVAVTLAGIDTVSSFAIPHLDSARTAGGDR